MVEKHSKSFEKSGKFSGGAGWKTPFFPEFNRKTESHPWISPGARPGSRPETRHRISGIWRKLIDNDNHYDPVNWYIKFIL